MEFKFLRRLKKFNIKFKKIETTDLVIVDQSTAANLIKFLDLRFFFLILHCSPAEILISFRLLFHCIKAFFNLSYYKNPYKLSKLNLIYLISFIEISNPKFVLTYTDNSLIYATLVANFSKKIKFIAIQNGHRPNYELNKNEFLHDEYIGFGSNVEKSLKKKNTKIKKFKSAGSLAAEFYFKKFNNLKIKFDVCLICQMPEAYDNIDFYLNNFSDKKRILILKSIKDSIYLMNKNLKIFINKYNYSLAVVLRDNNKKNISFYQRLFGKNLKYIGADNAYKLMSKSKIVIGFNTTCVQECWGFNKKALLIDYSGNNLCNDIINTNLIIRNKSFSYFEKKIREIFGYKSNIYTKIITKHRFQYMNNSYNKIKKYIKKTILKSAIQNK
jgi:hypothetical protein